MESDPGKMLVSRTDPEWLRVALGDFDRVLVDHAHCEKKAAAQALALVGSYPDHEMLVRKLSALAIEELRHFREVHARLRKRGLRLGPDPGDPYARALRAALRSRGEERLLDRLLVCGLIESRSHERLALLAGGLEDSELTNFYAALARNEAGHADLFIELARTCVKDQNVELRLGELAELEARVVQTLPIEPRIH